MRGNSALSVGRAAPWLVAVSDHRPCGFDAPKDQATNVPGGELTAHQVETIEMRSFCFTYLRPTARRWRMQGRWTCYAIARVGNMYRVGKVYLTGRLPGRARHAASADGATVPPRMAPQSWAQVDPADFCALRALFY